jgi:hypothetical protein
VQSATQQQQQQQRRQWQQQEDSSDASAEDPDAVDMSFALHNLNLQQQQQQQPIGGQQQQHGGGQPQQAYGQQQQQQQQQPSLAVPSALQLVGANTYLLVAAAGSGCPRVLSAVMQNMQVRAKHACSSSRVVLSVHAVCMMARIARVYWVYAP